MGTVQLAFRRHLDAGSSLERVVFAVHGSDAAAAFRATLAGGGERERA